MDAYSGEVTLYQFDDKDPVLKTWMKVFPDSVKSRAEFDNAENADLRDHVRYPEDLFKIQRQLLTKYHVTTRRRSSRETPSGRCLPIRRTALQSPGGSISRRTTLLPPIPRRRGPRSS